jgi:polyisoprenoid-binding protein YceI
MNATHWAVIVALNLAAVPGAIGQSRPIDVKTSVMTVHVFKAGLFSAMGHDHEIAAPLSSGSVDAAGHHVELHVTAAALQVRDPKGSEKDRGEIQKTMLGPDVLDVEHHAEIVFRSSGAEPAGAGSWTVRGDLALHGQTRPVTLAVTEKAGHYVGTARLKQTDFGIKPIKIAGGAVRVKDEVQIDFDIQLAR